eukprot:gene17748-23347_t
MQEENLTIDELKREFVDFLESDIHDGKYIDKIKTCLQDKSFRLIVNVNDLRNNNQRLATNVIRGPRKYMVALQEAAKEVISSNNDPTISKLLKSNEIQIGFEGSLGANFISPRGLLSSLLNNLVEVEGIITKCSNVRPKLCKSVHYCEITKQYSQREYRDASSLDIGIEVNGRERKVTSSVVPTQDETKNSLELEQGLSIYKDYQTLLLQEMPERARVGQLPRSVEVILEYDLVDKVKPGDRVRCVGVYRPFPNSHAGQTSGVFRSILIANNISVIGRDVGAVKLTGKDVENIRDISTRNDLLDLMAGSFCPSIFGHEYIKKALVLQLLGGCERNLENGTHLRGDINILLVGDPSTAKSQMLRAIMDIAPLAISTTGRGASGVGLTAAVTFDSETGDKRLEAGAMVLADRGIVCVDEFDKMSENDRVAIHEVMEQQTVTIAKAGIHASLNARCSVLAAANPVYGQYDRTRRPQENIGLPDSLLSRFDLLFIVLDQLDPDFDRSLSEHVILSHQYRRPGTIMEPEPLHQVSVLNLEDNEERIIDTPVWLRGGPSNKNINNNSNNNYNQLDDIFTKEFLRKYIHFAKHRINPVLSESAMEAISDAYGSMRSKQTKKNLPVTARSLETMIRLSTAHAKLRLSDIVEVIDVDEALLLLNFVMFHEINDYTTAKSVQKVVATSVKTNTVIDVDEDNTSSSDNDDNLSTTISNKHQLEIRQV